MPLSVGDKLGPYEILAPIGAGGMGELWKARDTRLNRIVAVKRLKDQHSARFEQEARAIASLNHPHICQIHDIGPDYLVLEYIEGRPLKGPHAVDEAMRLATQIAEALDVAHRKGVVHRDLKPANIMVTSEGSIKLLDFGLAKQVAHSSVTTTLETETLEGTVMGTAPYMSPEQARGKPLDARSDIFSFGAVLYELLSGRRAFDAENVVATMAAILHTEPAPLHTAPAALQAIVKRCLAKPPEQRFQTMADVRTALQQVSSKPADKQPSIAVLPFANMGGDKENEYFSDGLAEETINFLAQIPGLKVTARTSAFAFKGKTEDIRKIARTLGVATVLEGSVRRSGSRIRVTAQLINAEDGYHLWSQRYDREMADLFDMQDEIGHAIASALQVKLSGTPAADQYRPSLPAYEALLKARYHLANFRPDTLSHVKDCYEQAIALDPKFAQAHCEYGNYFLAMALAGALPANQALPAMRRHAQNALELDPSFPDAHAMLGMVAAYLEYDWKEAERRFGLGIVRDSVQWHVRFMYAVGYLTPTGQQAEAVAQMDRAIQEDPLNPLVRYNRANCLSAAGREEEAEEALREVLVSSPAMALAYVALGVQHLVRGKLEQALELVEKAYTLTPLYPNVLGVLAGLLMRTGDTPRAEELLRKLQPGDAFGAPRALALYHWVLRDFDAAADWFEKAIDQHDPYAAVYLRYWYGRELRSTPRWAGLMRKLNLPES